MAQIPTTTTYAGVAAGAPIDNPAPATTDRTKRDKQDKHERRSKKEKRPVGTASNGVAPIDADDEDDETVRALRAKMEALHSQIAALEQKRVHNAQQSPIDYTAFNQPSTTSSTTFTDVFSAPSNVGLDGGSDGRFLAPSSGNLLLAGSSEETLAVHSDADLDADEEEQPTTSSAPSVVKRGAAVAATTTTTQSSSTSGMNPSATSFTPNAGAPAFIPGGGGGGYVGGFNQNRGGSYGGAPHHGGTFRPYNNNQQRGPFLPGSTQQPRTSFGTVDPVPKPLMAGQAHVSSRPTNTGSSTITVAVDNVSEGDGEPQKLMSYNKNHHHDVVRDLMMLMKQQLAISKARVALDGPEALAAERRAEGNMSTRPGFAQFSRSSDLHEQHQNALDEQRANAAAMVRSVLGEHGSGESLSVSHTADGKVLLTERLRKLADNPEAAARLLASLTENEANAIAKEVFSPPSTKDYVVVEYKRERTKKFPCDIPGVVPGDYVIVDGDRGTDCGLVVQVAKARPNHTYEVECMSSMVKNNVRKKMEKGRVIRVATTDEIFQLHNEIAEVEKDALHLCRNKCIEHGIDVDLVDCEVQFDRKKVSFFFNSPVAIDFRALVRDLYNTFHIRIWMENISPKVRNAEPFLPMSGASACSSSRGGRGGGAPTGSPTGDSFSVGSFPHQHHSGGRGAGGGYRGGRGGAARNWSGGYGSDHHSTDVAYESYSPQPGARWVGEQPAYLPGYSNNGY